MTFELRPLQQKFMADARLAFAQYDRVLMVAGCGFGKTVVASHIAMGAAKKGNRSIFVVHRVELVSQMSAAFTRMGVPHGIIAPGHTQTDDLVQIGMVQTIVRRLEVLKRPTLLFLDEAHHATSNAYKKLVEYWKCKVGGLTATPERLDGRGLNEVFQYMVLGPSAGDLMREEWLCTPRIYAPPSNLDLSGVHRRGGDYDKLEIANAVEKSSIVGDSVDHYLKICAGKRAIAFCPSVAESKRLVERFIAAGVPAEHVDGGTDKGQRKAAIDNFVTGRTLVLSNVDLFSEGTDVPLCEVVILLRPTQSKTLHVQQSLRGARLSEGKREYIILDHVANCLRLGLPDEEYDWTLEGTAKAKGKKKEKEVKIKQCEKCYCCHVPAPSCPSCGHVYPVRSRKIEQKEGSLVELSAEKARIERERRQAIKKREMEEGMAKTFDELVALAKSRNYNNPWGWARLRIMQRKKKGAA